MGGTEKQSISTAPSSQDAFSLTVWWLRELGWVVGVFAHDTCATGEQSCVTVPVHKHS